MRLMLALLLVLVTPAVAAEWSHYENARFGYGIDVPAGFVAQGEADNGDGQMFKTPTARLSVFGGNVMERDFESEVVARERFAEQDSWSITYAMSTPDRASFSGRRGARIVYARMIALCGGTQFAMFEMEYSRADLQQFDPVVERLTASLKAIGGSC
jgi:hypothetical protein